MKSRTLFYIAVSVVALNFRADGQTAASPTPRPTPPSEPLLKPAPDFAAWTIVRQSIPGLEKQSTEEVTKSATTANKPDNFSSVTKTGLVRHLTTTLKTREHEDVWYEHGNRILMESVWKTPVFERSVNPSNQPAGPDFPEFAWISTRNFVGTQDGPGGTYFVFESDVAEGDANAAKEYGTKLRTTHRRAFINADTRLPWLLQSENILQRFVFQDPPAGMLEVPAEYQTMFDTYEKKKIESLRKPLAP